MLSGCREKSKRVVIYKVGVLECSVHVGIGRKRLQKNLKQKGSDYKNRSHLF